MNRAITIDAQAEIRPGAVVLRLVLFLAVASWQPAINAQTVGTLPGKPQIEVIALPGDPDPIRVVKGLQPSGKHRKSVKAAGGVSSFDIDHGGNVPQATPSGFVLDGNQVVALYSDPRDARATDFVFDHGGARVVSNDLQLIFFGHEWLVNNAPSPAMNNVKAMVRQVLGGPYLSELAQYNFKSLNLSTPFTVVLQEPPTFFDMSDVDNLIWDLIDGGTFPEPDEGGRFVYMVFMPQTGTAKFDSQSKPRGEHGVAYDQDWVTDVDYAWVAWVSNGDINYTSNVFTHELVESITDPEPPESPIRSGAWLMNRPLNSGNRIAEIGDACSDIVDFLNGIFVQAYWSQKHSSCAIPFGPLKVDSISPKSGPMTGGTSVTISGGGFMVVGVQQVFFGNVPAQSFTVDSLNQITAVSPMQTAWNVDVWVQTQAGPTPRNAVADTFNYLPVVTGATPNSGPMIGNQTVSVSGLGFNDRNATTFVFGTNSVTTNCNSVTQCSVTAPNSSTPGPVDVTVSGGPANPPNDYFNYQGPTITSIKPAIGSERGSTPVEIYGTSLTSGMTVKFGNVPALSFYCITSGWCEASSPPEPLGNVFITVTVNGIQSPQTPRSLFTYAPFPYGTMSPNTGPAGTNITVTGGNFITNPGATTFNFLFDLGSGGSAPAKSVNCTSSTVCYVTSPDCSGTQCTTPTSVTVTVGADQGPSVLPPIYFTTTLGNYYYPWAINPDPPPDPNQPPKGKCPGGICQ